MNQIIIGVIIGIFTSFVAGIILVWKGEQIVHRFRYLPNKMRVALYTRAYLIAIRSYPYRYAHLIAMVILSMVILSTFLGYILLTVFSFHLDISQSPEVVKESLRSTVDLVNSRIISAINPWVLSFITVLTALIGQSLLLKTIPAELLVPYAYRELNRLRECVLKCSTKKQYLEYTDAEHKVRTLKDLRELITTAKTILGNVDLHLTDEILNSVSEDFPELESISDNNNVNS